MNACSGQPSWQSLIDEVAADRESGASALAGRVATALGFFAAQEHPANVDSLLAMLREIAVRIVGGQPSMAPLVRVLNDALRVCRGAPSAEEALRRLREFAEAYLAASERAAQLLANHLGDVLAGQRQVVTISFSTAVVSGLLQARSRAGGIRVTCLESRPGYEGRRLAALLAENGFAVDLCVDAAAYSVLRGADLWLAGSDSLCVQGVVNKIGTAGLAAAAASLGVRGLIAADSQKVWAGQLGLPAIAEFEPAGVWQEAPQGVSVINRCFDLTPWELITAVVTESGLLSPNDVVEQCARLEVEPVLAQIVRRATDFV